MWRAMMVSLLPSCAVQMWALSDALGDKVSGTLTYKERHRNRAKGHTFDIRELDIHCWRNN